jgi:hypothetical protein
MRKAERMRMIELQLLTLEFEVEILRASIEAILQANNVTPPDIDAGKWYRSRNDNR